MPPPAELQTFALTFGPYTDLSWQPAAEGITGRVVPVHPDSGQPITLRHIPTGTTVLPAEGLPIVIGSDGTGRVEGLPFVDSPDLTPTGFAYAVQWRPVAGRQPLRSSLVAVTTDYGPEIPYDPLVALPAGPLVHVPPRVTDHGDLTGLDADDHPHYLTAGRGDGRYALTAAGVTDAERAKLAGVQAGATANDTDANLRDRATHTGVQPADTVTGLAAVATSGAYADLAGRPTIPTTPAEVGADPAGAADAAQAHAVQRTNHTGTQSLDTTADSAGRLALVPAERAKLAGVQAGATVNATDAALRDRGTHTGTQPTGTITDLREFIEDTVGGMLQAVGVDLDISYDDASGSINIDYTGISNDPEAIRDTIGAAMVGLGNITVLVNDDADTITIVTSATVNDTDANLRDRATHTGVQLASTISDFAAAAQAALAATVAIINAELVSLDGRLDTAEGTLSAATSSGVGGTLARRTSGGDITFGRVYANSAPVASTELTRVDWVQANGALTPAVASGAASGTVAVASSGAPVSTRRYQLAGNLTVDTLPTLTIDRASVVSLILRQAASGGPYTVTWPGNLTWLTAVPTMPTTASAFLRVELLWTGTEWLGIAAEADLDAATSAANINALVRRGSTGGATFSTLTVNSAPSSIGHATRKDYVDTYGSMAPAAYNPSTGASASVTTSVLPSVRTWVLSANLTIGALPTPASDRAGTVTLVLKQPASGGPFTVTWPSALVWAGGASAPAMPTQANAELIVRLLWTGVAWRGLVVGTFFP